MMNDAAKRRRTETRRCEHDTKQDIARAARVSKRAAKRADFLAKDYAWHTRQLANLEQTWQKQVTWRMAVKSKLASKFALFVAAYVSGSRQPVDPIFDTIFENFDTVMDSATRGRNTLIFEEHPTFSGQNEPYCTSWQASLDDSPGKKAWLVKQLKLEAEIRYWADELVRHDYTSPTPIIEASPAKKAFLQLELELKLCQQKATLEAQLVLVVSMLTQHLKEGFLCAEGELPDTGYEAPPGCDCGPYGANRRYCTLCRFGVDMKEHKRLFLQYL
jgi:hypothetical protein